MMRKAVEQAERHQQQRVGHDDLLVAGLVEKPPHQGTQEDIGETPAVRDTAYRTLEIFN